MLGHGLGAEIITLGLSGSVIRSSVKEVGWFQVDRMENSIASEWFSDTEKRCFNIFQWHRQATSTPEGGMPILKSKWDPCEAYAQDNILANQGHLEITKEMVYQWLSYFDEDIAEPVNETRADEKLTLIWDANI